MRFCRYYFILFFFNVIPKFAGFQCNRLNIKEIKTPEPVTQIKKSSNNLYQFINLKH